MRHIVVFHVTKLLENVTKEKGVVMIMVLNKKKKKTTN